MKQSMTSAGLTLKAAFGALCAACLLGCDDPSSFDHTPPSGQGTLIVDNLTPDDINVYLDGASLGQAGDDSSRTYDMKPGVYRVVLDDEHHDRSYASDVDILEGRLTVLHVHLPGYGSAYNVSSEFQ